MVKYLKQIVVWLIILAMVWFVVQTIKTHQSAPVPVEFSKFLEELDKGNIKDVVISGNDIQGTYVTPKEPSPQSHFQTVDGFRDDQELQKELRDKKVEVKFEPKNDNPWGLLLVQFLPYLLLFGFFVLIMRQAQAGGSQAFAFGRSRAKQLSDNRPKVTFEDVAGVEEAKEELQEVVDYLKYPKKYQQLGARIPKGVLLLGAPGTGKTLLGRAIAGEAGVPFYYISGSDFVEMFVGVGASRVRDLFEQAKKNAPCIVFVDEIDAVGRQRGAGVGGGHDEREQTLNQLLVEMDGFEPNLGVIILAATNRPDVLDPALLRPGRFDRHVVVDKPDINGRKAILKVHARGKPLSEDVDLEILARRTPGFSGADLENLLNEAALLAARAGRTKVEVRDCEEAIDRVIMGPEKKSRIQGEKERVITAYHESGHTLIAKLIPESDPVRKVTILPRGMSLGATWHVPAGDKYNMNRKELIASISGLLGGRVAEEIVFGEADVTTGASNDLERATQIARDMVCKYGMSDRMGLLTFGKKQEQVFLGRDIMEDKNYSEDVANQIDKEVRRIMDECYDRTRNLLLANRHRLEALVKNLLEKEVLDGDEVDRILSDAGSHNGSPESTEKPMVG
ncbi:MAG TPA: ATP-dependent zinc metalloprotease FtsH [Candidatus Xenobia bacterium]